MEMSGVFVYLAVILSLGTGVLSKHIVKRDASAEVGDEDNDSGEGFQSMLGGILGDLEQIMDEVDAEVAGVLGDVMDGQNPDDLPVNYDNSTSQETRINNTMSMETNSSVHRENKGGVEETVIEKTQVLKDKDNQVIGQGSQVEVDIVSVNSNNSEGGKGQGQKNKGTKNGKTPNDIFKQV